MARKKPVIQNLGTGRIFPFFESETPDILVNWEDRAYLLEGESGGGAGVDTTAIHDNVANEISAITEKNITVSGDLIVIEDSANSYNKKRVKVGNLSDALAIHTNRAGEINSLAAKAVPTDSDLLVIEDAANSHNKKKLQIGNLPKNDPYAIHDNISAEISALTEKTTPLDADWLIIEDSATTNSKKKLQIGNLPKVVLSIPDMATLEATTSSDGQVAILEGYYSSGDGGGGTFVWDTVSIADDRGTIINPDGGSSAGWRRIYSKGEINVKWFGAKGDGVTDDTIAIQTTFDSCTSGGTILFPAGRFKITDTLIPQKYPGNTGVFGVLNIRGAGAAGVDDLFTTNNYGTTIYVPSPEANTPVFDIMVTRGIVIESLNIQGTNGVTASSVAVSASTTEAHATFRDVAFWGWETGVLIGGAANSDDWVFDNCRFHFCTTAIKNTGTESYLVRANACRFQCEVAFHTTGDISGSVMNSFLANECMFNCSDAVIRYSSPSAAHNGRAVIKLDSCVVEGVGVPWIFDCESLAANNALGLTIKQCVLNVGFDNAVYDPNFRFIRYYGRGPFIFEGNVVSGSYRFPVEIVCEASTVNVGAVRWANNFFATGPPLFLAPLTSSLPLIYQQGNYFEALPTQKSTDGFSFGPWPGSEDIIFNNRRLGGTGPTLSSTWEKGSSYANTTTGATHVCTTAGTYGTVSGCTATLISGNNYATYVAGTDTERRKVWAGMFVSIGAATPLKVHDVVNDIIYLRETWAGATQTAAAVSYVTPVFSALSDSSHTHTDLHSHSNKSELDLVSDGDHDVRTDNPHGVDKTDVGLSNVQNTKVNLSAAINPTTSDDNVAGYSAGSRWVNLENTTEFVCVDAATGAAGWLETTDEDTIHTTVSGEIYGVTLKGTPADNDVLLIEDVANSYNKKKITLGSILGAAGTIDRLLVFADDTEFEEIDTSYDTKKTFRIIRDSAKKPSVWRLVLTLWITGGGTSADCQLTVTGSALVDSAAVSSTATLETQAAAIKKIDLVIEEDNELEDVLLTVDIDLKQTGGGTAHLKYTDLYAIFTT